MEQIGGKAVYKPYRLCCIYQLYSMPACGIMTYMHFFLPVHRAALRADISAFVQRYLRPCPEISPSLPADISARARRYLCPRAFMPRLIPPTAYYFPNLSYSASVTGSSHSLEVFSPGISKARWANQLSAAAPCQCFTLAGMWMTSPGSICTASLPSS